MRKDHGEPIDVVSNLAILPVSVKVSLTYVQIRLHNIPFINSITEEAIIEWKRTEDSPARSRQLAPLFTLQLSGSRFCTMFLGS